MSISVDVCASTARFVRHLLEKNCSTHCSQVTSDKLSGTCLRRSSPPTAVGEHLSDSKDVNNCLELSTRACILIFNDNFALAKSVSKDQERRAHKAAAPVPGETSTNGT